MFLTRSVGGKILFKELIQMLSTGIPVDNTTIFCRNISFARSKTEKKTTVWLNSESVEIALLDLVLFTGMKPWYRPWIEITYPHSFKTAKDQIDFSYYNSNIEKKLIDLCCQHLSSAGKIFVSYDSDMETAKALMLNIPSPLTRLGFLLFQSGCTWFKDWYFPEGGLEGGQKLQGEKPLNNKNKTRQIFTLKKQILAYVDSKREDPSLNMVECRALKRGNDVLKLLHSK